jgi:hypothetical protein
LMRIGGLHSGRCWKFVRFGKKMRCESVGLGSSPASALIEPFSYSLNRFRTKPIVSQGKLWLASLWAPSCQYRRLSTWTVSEFDLLA